MTECKFEDLIDEYLLNKLGEEKRDQFEEHYFNCPACFQKMADRDDMIAAIKWKGPEIFADRLEENRIRPSQVLQWSALQPPTGYLAWPFW